MDSFLQVTKAIFNLIPMVVLNPQNIVGFSFFWIMVFVVMLQYKRLSMMEKGIYGVSRNVPWLQTTLSLVSGLIGGIIASWIMVFVGVTVSGSGIGYVMLLALLLMTVNPRLVCFAYAGGIVSLSNLIFGFPDVSIPSLMALVAVLHIAESILIALTGAMAPTPVYIKQKSGDVVGGFTLQRFWPIPLVLLSMQYGMGGGAPIDMPSWWPLIRLPESILNDPSIVLVMVPVVAILGYGDMAITRRPQKRVMASAGALSLFSVTLLGLSVISSYYPLLQWLAALFGPVGHEIVAMYGSRAESSGKPAFVPSDRGVMILDTLPGSVSEKMGIETGDIVTEFNGTEVRNRQEFGQLIRFGHVQVPYAPGSAAPPGSPEREASTTATVDGSARLFQPAVDGVPEPARNPLNTGYIVVARDGKQRKIRLPDHWAPGHFLGLIPVPEPDDNPHVEMRKPAALVTRLRRLLKI